MKRRDFVLGAAASAVACLGARSVHADAPDPDPKALKRGEFVWHPEISPAGPVVVVVSLDEQRAYVYRNGIAIGVSTISSGRRGHETPTGVFTILQKEVEHYSNQYDDAPMPYMERLTWDGVALHGGALPGYPASHGCVRLPAAFARKLYEITTRGVVVVVANARSAPASVVHPATLAPVDARNGAPSDLAANAADFSWNDTPLAAGPIALLLSTGERRAYVFRNGHLIGSAQYASDAAAAVGGSVLYVMGEGFADATNVLDPARPPHRWSAYPLPTRSAPAPRVDAPTVFHVPPAFARRVYDLLTPGTTVLVTDLPSVRPGVDSAPVRVLESNARTGTSPRVP